MAYSLFICMHFHVIINKNVSACVFLHVFLSFTILMMYFCVKCVACIATLQWRHNGRDLESPASRLFTHPFKSGASLACVWGIHRSPVNSPHKWPVTRKLFPFDDVIMTVSIYIKMFNQSQKFQCHPLTLSNCGYCSMLLYINLFSFHGSFMVHKRLYFTYNLCVFIGFMCIPWT